MAGNSLSRSFIQIGDTPFSKCSSGSKILMHLVSILFSKASKIVLIGEPELGLTPRIQNAIQRLIFEQFDQHLDHLNHIYIATHSHIFLSKRNLKDNFLVRKIGSSVHVMQIATRQKFRDLQFTQLGNSFEHFQLPSGFIIVEGITDHKYLSRLMRLMVSDHRATVISANSDGQITTKLNDVLKVIGKLDTSPYCDRVLVVLDKVHSPTLLSKLENMGLKENCIIKWKENGIEHYYPDEILQKIFEDETVTAKGLKIDGDKVSHGGVEKTKTELCNEVVERLTDSDQMDSELEAFLDRVERLSV